MGKYPPGGDSKKGVVMDRDDRGRSEETEEESFPDLLDSTYEEPARLEPGEKISAKIIGITSDHVFLDLGRKGEGCLEGKEFHDADGNLTVKEGDTIQVFFLGTRNNELWFTTRIGSGAVGQAQMEDAWRNGIPVEGHVEKEIKGGFSVRIAGGYRGFCPYSQMGLASAERRIHREAPPIQDHAIWGKRPQHRSFPPHPAGGEEAGGEGILAGNAARRDDGTGQDHIRQSFPPHPAGGEEAGGEGILAGNVARRDDGTGQDHIRKGIRRLHKRRPDRGPGSGVRGRLEPGGRYPGRAYDRAGGRGRGLEARLG
jgi:hypothetical protein